MHFPRIRLRVAGHASIAAVVASGFMPVAAETVVRPDYDKNDHILKMSPPSSTGVINRELPDYNISGASGDGYVRVVIGKNITLPNPTSYYALTGLGIEERGNDPCLLRLFGTLVDPRYQGPVRVVATEKLEGCRSILPSLIDYKGVGFSKSSSYFNFNIDGKQFIRSLQVCGGRGTLLPQRAYSSEMWKIKGIKIMASEVRLADSPLLRPDILMRNTVEEFIRANCPDRIADAPKYKPGWSEWSNCPTGQVATGVDAYKGKDKYFTGLKLICKAVSHTRIDAPPLRDSVGY